MNIFRLWAYNKEYTNFMKIFLFLNNILKVAKEVPFYESGTNKFVCEHLWYFIREICWNFA